MTKRDWTQDDARELAEFAGYRVENDLVYDSEEVICRLSNSYAGGGWKPWSLKAPMWQLQSLYDAVREKGLAGEFERKLNDVVDYPDKPELSDDPTEIQNQLYKHQLRCDFELYSAPPEAICSAILQLDID